MPFYPIAAAHKVCTNSMKVKYFPIKPFHKCDKINDSNAVAHLLMIGIVTLYISTKKKICHREILMKIPYHITWFQ